MSTRKELELRVEELLASEQQLIVRMCQLEAVIEDMFDRIDGEDLWTALDIMGTLVMRARALGITNVGAKWDFCHDEAEPEDQRGKHV